MCVRVNVRCVWVAFVGGCFACGCVLERVVFRVRFARVSCPWLRFERVPSTVPCVSIQLTLSQLR